MNSIDSMAKNDDCFPKPEQNRVLFVDGFGFDFIHAEQLLPALLMNTVLEYIGSVEFTSLFSNLFSNKTVTTGFLFQLPNNYSIRYNSNNRLYQDVYHNDVKLFSVLYGRDYNNLRISTDLLDDKLRSKDLVIPELKTKIKADKANLYRYTEHQEWVEYSQTQLPDDLKSDCHRSVVKVLKSLFAI